jgi:starch phosphorylase
MSTTSPEYYVPAPLKKVIQAIRDGTFGQKDILMKLLATILNNNDWYLLTADFEAYIVAQKEVDEAYKNQEDWTKRSILNAIRSGKFSSDRTITEYAKQIWNIKPQKVFEGEDSRVIIS